MTNMTNTSKLIKATTFDGFFIELWFNAKTTKFDIWHNHKKAKSIEGKGFVTYDDAENNAKAEFENYLGSLEKFELPKKDAMTTHQRELRALICDYRDELIGGLENAWLDEPEQQWMETYGSPLPTKQWAIDTIYGWIMNDKTSKYLYGMKSNIAIERKHVHFIGEKFIRALIDNRIDYDFRTHGWAFPNNYFNE